MKQTKLNFWPGASLLSFVIESLRDSGVLPKKLGNGVLTAQRDLAAHRQAQADRLKNAAEPVVTRQQIRHFQRRQMKMPLDVSMKDWHRFMGYPV